MKKHVLRTLSALLVVCLLLTASPLNGFAGLQIPQFILPSTADAATIVASGSCGSSATYTLDSDGVLNISGTGTVTQTLQWDTLTIKNVIINNGITAIADYVFTGHTELESVTFPDTLTSIGKWAFYWCIGLTEITIPRSVKNIGEQAFGNCDALTDVNYCGSASEWNSITIHTNNATLQNASIHFNSSSNTVVSSGACGSSSTYTLDSNGVLTISGTGTVFKASAWKDYTVKEVIINNGITSLSVYAFKGLPELTKVTLPDTLTIIGSWVFEDCTALETINIPEGVTFIGESAFEKCYSLQNINFPESLESIGNYAFYMADLNEVYIPAKLKNIGIDVFTYCMPTRYTVAAGNTSYSSQDGVLYNKNKTILLKYPGGDTRTSFAVPVGVKIISDLAFERAYNLQSVVLSDSVTTLGEYAFVNCSTNLQSVTLSENLKSIPYGAFAGCGQLKAINIPDSVTMIESDAFAVCLSLESVTLSANVKTINTDAFYSCESLQDVYFDGTQEQWDTLNIADGNDSLFDAEIHFKEKASVVASGSCGVSAAWTLDSDGVLTISGSGAMYDYTDAAPWYIYRNSVYSVVINPGITSIGNLAFAECENLVSVSMPDTLTRIGELAFYLCLSLKSVKIPESVTAIHFGAFFGCAALTAVSLPAGITLIESAAFALCVRLQSIQIDSKNEYYQTVNGVLYNKDMSELISYPAGKTSTVFTIPSGVKTIHAYAFACVVALKTLNIPEGISVINVNTFSYAFNLQNVVIPASVQLIAMDAFTACSKLTTVTIGKGSKLVMIQENAFAECTALETVYFGATQSKWNSISVAGGNNTLLGATFHFESEAQECIHKWDNGVITVQPTTTKEGIRTYTCYNCGTKKTETIEKLAKSWSASEQYSFNNSSAHFATGRYTMLDSDFEKMSNYIKMYYSEQDAQLLINKIASERMNNIWGGSCFGMASTALLDYNGMISMKNFDANANSISEVDSPKVNPKVQSAINYYQLSQSIPLARFENFVYYENSANYAYLFKEGCINLINFTKKAEPLLFCYWFSRGGHAIVAKDYSGKDANGNHVITAYDNRYPEKDIQIIITSDYTNCTVRTPYGDELTYAFGFYTSLTGFDIIDIDGPNNDMVVNFNKERDEDLTTELSVIVNGDMTIWNNENEYINIENGQINSTMHIMDTYMIVHSDADGNPAPVELVFTVSDSDYFMFETNGNELNANVCTSDSYASITATEAYAATITTDNRISVSGTNAEYTVHQSVADESYDMLSVSGVSNGSTHINFEDNYAFVSGNKSGEQITFGKLSDDGYVENTYDTKNSSVTVNLGSNDQTADILLGDVDNDGAVTASDARFTLRAAVNLETLTETQTMTADADNDGEISASDARLILRAAVGLETLSKK